MLPNNRRELYWCYRCTF